MINYYIVGCNNHDLFFKQLSSENVNVLDSNKFTPVHKDSIDFLKDVHSWKWYFACGRRMMIVGVGVSAYACYRISCN